MRQTNSYCFNRGQRFADCRRTAVQSGFTLKGCIISSRDIAIIIHSEIRRADVCTVGDFHVIFPNFRYTFDRFTSFHHSGMLAIRSAPGHQTARKGTSQTTPSLLRANITPFTTRQTPGNRTCRLRPQRPVSSQNYLCAQSEGRKLEYSYRRPVIPRHKRALRPKWILRTGSMELRLGTADWGRFQSGQGSIAWSASFLWKNILRRQRKADFARAAGSGREALPVAEVRIGDF